VGADARGELAALARRWVEVGWSAGDGTLPAGAIVDELHDPLFIDHDSGSRPPDNTGFRDGIVRLLAAFPDLEARALDVVVEPAATCAGASGATSVAIGGAKVSGTIAVRWTAVGTHRGAYLGAEPTGKRITFKGIEVIRVRDGRITERWGEWDGLDLLGQLERDL
jgi:predicted ester cyclase